MSQPPVGIDLGTTFSVLAWLDASGRPQTLLNREGDILTPSAVLFENASIVVGKEAIKAAALEPDRIALWAKRDMGSPCYRRPIAGHALPPEVIQSMVLEKLRRDAEPKIGPLRTVVVTVPAYFNEPRRKATQDAGHLAGLEVLDIINEPTAAAIAYGRESGFLDLDGAARQTERVLVYDLGGGTFDVTLMEIDGNRFRALATAGDVYLGGIDWDSRLVDHLAEQYRAKHRMDPRDNPAGMHRLLREAEEAKRSLSAREQVTVSFEHAGEGVRVTVARSQFEELTADLLERTRFTTNNVMRDAQLAWSDITRILLVGGSTRMPAVQQMLEQISGMRPDQSLSADEAVAHGAAIYAGILMSGRQGAPDEVRIENVNSHDLGVLGIEPETRRPRSAVLIPRNTPLPARIGKRFQTAKLNQRSVAVNVIEGGDAAGQGATPIGRCVIRDLPPDLPKDTPVDVIFQYAPNGRLTVRARLPSINHTAKLVIERASGLSEKQLSEWGARLADGEMPLAPPT